MRGQAAGPPQEAEAGDLPELIVEGQARRAGEVLAGEDRGRSDGVREALRRGVAVTTTVSAKEGGDGGPAGGGVPGGGSPWRGGL